MIIYSENNIQYSETSSFEDPIIACYTQAITLTLTYQNILPGWSAYIASIANITNCFYLTVSVIVVFRIICLNLFSLLSGLLPAQRSGGGPPHRNDAGRFQGVKNNRDKERERERERERRERKENRLKRQRSPSRSVKSPAPRPRSPIRRRPARVIPRYVVQIPKLSLETWVQL